MRRSAGSSLLLITGFLVCPCHVPLTLPLLVALFGGTALGTWLSTHAGLMIGLRRGLLFHSDRRRILAPESSQPREWRNMPISTAPSP